MKEKLKKKNSYRNIEKEENGITLVALVVTIIILIILAGIAIARLTGDNGIITKASSANKKQIEATVTEKIELAVETAKLDAKSKLTQTVYTAEENLEMTAKVIGKELNENEELVSTKNSYQLICTTSNNEGRITITYGKAGIDGDTSSISGNEDYATACNYDDAVIVTTVKVKGNSIEITGTVGNVISTDGNYAETEDLLSGENTSTGMLKIKKNNTTIIASTDIATGDEVTIGDENFFVIKNNPEKVYLLAKYCIDTEFLIQVNGNYSTEATKFSSGHFWADRNDIIYPYNFPTDDYENQNNYALYAAARYGEKIGTTGRLMYTSEASTLVNNFGDIIYGKNINATNGYLNYWLGTANGYYSAIDAVFGSGNGRIGWNFASYGEEIDNLWVRPVLEILWANI